jgi:2-keto-4-pentenoate hydratase/2-oxohepta-3-ene-1,7-dioic acid hydratase in catechol pathway
MQDGNTSDMIFPVAKLIAFLSTGMTLMPGDIISTGTPAGVGTARDPKVFLKDGDEVSIEIEGLGTLTNPVQAE